MRPSLAVVAAITIVSCAAPPDITVPGDDGRKYILIRCRDVQNCLIRAGRYCPAGYVDRHEGKRAHELLIRCKSEPDTSLGDWK